MKQLKPNSNIVAPKNEWITEGFSQRLSIKDIYFYGWNRGALRHEHLYLDNDYQSAFELFSIHCQKGKQRNISLIITILNLTWVLSIEDGR